jgi:hypothetical protein
MSTGLASKTDPSIIKTPRNFQLLDDLDNVKNYDKISYGLETDDDTYLVNWKANLFLDNGEIIDLSFVCDKATFPTTRPKVKFSQEALKYKPVKRFCTDDGSLQSLVESQLRWNDAMPIGDYIMSIRACVNGNSN